MPRSLRFRYNPVFLPEYLSTVLISIPISAVFMTTPLGGGRGALVANPHLGFAIALYVLVAGWLLTLTVIYRLRFCPVVFSSLGQMEAGGRQIEIPNVTGAQQSLGKFFGRLVRLIRVENHRGESVLLCDAMFDYDAIRRLLEELISQRISDFPHDDPKSVHRVKSTWTERHEMFPPSETLGDVFSRLSWRGVCLLPVAVVDVLINLATILSLSRFQKHALMVYSAPLALLASGFIARFVYYYMFTSTTMNKPMGVPAKK